MAYRFNRRIEYISALSRLENSVFELEVKEAATRSSQAIRDLSNPSEQELGYALRLEKFAKFLDDESIVLSWEERLTLEDLVKQSPNSLKPGYELFAWPPIVTCLSLFGFMFIMNALDGYCDF